MLEKVEEGNVIANLIRKTALKIPFLVYDANDEGVKIVKRAISCLINLGFGLVCNSLELLLTPKYPFPSPP